MLATLTATAQAHHSFTSFFDLTKTVEISGVVKSVKLVNPHPEMIVEVTEPNGTGSGPSPDEPLAVDPPRGWNADTVPLGMNVKVEGHPTRKEGAGNIAAGKITRRTDSKSGSAAVGDRGRLMTRGRPVAPTLFLDRSASQRNSALEVGGGGAVFNRGVTCSIISLCVGALLGTGP